MRVFSWFTLNERKEGQLPSGRLRTRVAEAVHPAAAAAAAAPSGSLEHRPPAALRHTRSCDATWMGLGFRAENHKVRV